MKILIAEDAGAARLLLSATLRKMGHQVVAVENGRKAWEAFQGETFDVAILDWMMPEIDGAKLSKMIRGEVLSHYPYIILLTMLQGKERYLEGMAAGADDFLSKPFDEDQLVCRLRVAERIISLHAYATEIEALLPICPRCKKVNDGEGNWLHLELYLARCAPPSAPEHCPACYPSASAGGCGSSLAIHTAGASSHEGP